MDQTAERRELAALDWNDLVARCMGRIEFAERILAKFQQLFCEDLATLERALESEDVETIRRVAHRLKGASANVSAGALHAEVARIEEAARANRVAEIPNRLDRLREEWSRFRGAVESSASLTS